MNSELASPFSPRFVSWRHTSGRWLLILLILLAFARLTWQLETKNLWWDESLSLQRAESDWIDLLAGRIAIDDGIYQRPTVDQHPFGYFVLLRLFVYLAGQSEFVLRFPSVMVSTLLLPGLWVLARFFARRGVLPGQTAPLALFLAAGSPFYLWYGQEARMYTLVALLAVISSYLLLRWAKESKPHTRCLRLIAYCGVTLAFVLSHYFAAFLLPVHALVLVGGVRSRRKLAFLLVGTGLLVVVGMIGTAAWFMLRRPYSGINFVSLPFSILLPDLLNAYSLGLSVNIEQVWWLDLVFGVLALLGGLWAIRRNGWQERGWLIPALVVTPILLLVLVSQIQPAYMNARHLSVISGFFLLTVAGGIGLVWQRNWVAGGLLCLLLMVGMGFSTRNYFTLPEYSKDDFAGLGDVLRQKMMPGDVLLLNPPHMLRLFRYYLPVDTISSIQSEGGSVHWWGVPTANGWAENERMLTELTSNYRRAWLVTSQMFPFADPEQQIEGWLESRAMRIREQSFYSPNSILKMDLFLLGGAVTHAMPSDTLLVQADFGDAIGLRGYRVGRPLWPGAVIPVTYYWRGLRPLDQHYKYIARLESLPAALAAVPIHPTEREFYDGFLPSIWWTPDSLIVEESEIGALPASFDEEVMLSLQLYSVTTLEKLPVVASETGAIRTDGDSLKLPFPLLSPEFSAPPKN
ncbi:MAG: glycosyltransferase family 39 protein [Caldilineaceae bacterium]|nr:glycosyltransferase family 39 protein [Caldilineaceae bacterium]